MYKGIAVVTGGSRGIGKAIVEQLIDDGYFVEYTYRISEELSSQLDHSAKNRCRGMKADSSNPEETQRYISMIYDEHERIDVLVNNAGITIDALIKDADWKMYERVLEVNLGGAFNYCNRVLPKMMKAGYGNIINISSLASHNIRYGNAFYGSSKAALERFSQTLALEAIRFNVAVNVVAPGFVETDLVKHLMEEPSKKRELLRQIPLRRLIKPEEVAQAVSFLVSRKPLLVGETLHVGGGAHLTS